MAVHPPEAAFELLADALGLLEATQIKTPAPKAPGF
jgi:hypothetical protein